MKTLDLNADIIDLRDIIARFEELEKEVENLSEQEDDSIVDELATLEAILEELKGYGGDEQWRGDWYPVTLIKDDYFVDYCQDLVSDIGDMPSEIPSYLVIDWDATADNMKQDYSSVEIDGTTYQYR